MTGPNDLAFPIDSEAPWHNGLTKREYFAIKILNGMLANDEPLPDGTNGEDLCDTAVMAADRLIEALNK